jgi:hypothetical protein
MPLEGKTMRASGLQSAGRTPSTVSTMGLSHGVVANAIGYTSSGGGFDA